MKRGQSGMQSILTYSLIIVFSLATLSLLYIQYINPSIARTGDEVNGFSAFLEKLAGKDGDSGDAEGTPIPNALGDITSCTTISSPGTYQLAASFTASQQDCIIIQANNAILNGAGFTLTNGNVVLSVRTTGATIKNMRINGGSIYGTETSDNIISNNVITNSPTNGISLSRVTTGDGPVRNNRIIGNTIEYAQQHGIWIGYGANGNIITDNSVRHTKQYAGIRIDQSSNNTLSTNNLVNNSVGIAIIGDANRLLGNIVLNNTQGITIDGERTVVESNSVCQNVLQDISCSQGISGSATGNAFGSTSCSGWVMNGQTTCQIISANAPGTSLFVKHFGGTAITDSAEITSQVQDAQGNIYVLARFIGTVDVGGTTVLGIGTSSFSTYVAKYDSLGNLVRVKKLTNGAFMKPAKITLSSSGDVVITGAFQSTVEFGDPSVPINSYYPPQGQSFSKTSVGSDDIFVARLSGSTLQTTWVTTFGSISSDNPYAATFDSDGNVWTVGRFINSMNVGSFSLTSSGYLDGFLVKLDGPTGTPLFARKIGSSSGSPDEISDVRAFSSGNILVTGHYSGTVDFGGISKTNTGGQYYPDMFVAKYDSSGNALWVQSFGGTAGTSVYPYSLSVNSAGDMVVTGIFAGGNVQIGSTSLTVGPTPTVFVSKLSSSGIPYWSTSYGGGPSSNDKGLDALIDNTGFVYVTGIVKNGFTFGGRCSDWLAGYATDSFVVKFDSLNKPGDQCVLVRRYTGPTDFDTSNAISFHESSNTLIIGGKFTGSTDFTLNVGVVNAYTAGNADGYIVKIQP